MTAKRTEPSPPPGPHSLAARAALAAGLVVAAFLGLIGLAMSRSEAGRELDRLQDTLHDYAIYYLTNTDFDRQGKLISPDMPATSKLSQPNSGLYALIQTRNTSWQSSSAIGHHFAFVHMLAPGESVFEGPIDAPTGQRLYYYSYGAAIDTLKRSIPLTVTLIQNDNQLESLNAVYRRSIIGSLAGVGLILIILQLLLLRWSLTPLRKVVSDMNQIEHGQSDHLASEYPLELQALTSRINAFIDSERDQRKRYRHTLADLAHSLKTPLAVVRSSLESSPGSPELRKEVLDQVRRMDELVAYQLARAAASGGRQTFASAIPIQPHAEDLVQSLEKVYAEKNVLCEFDIEDGAAFYGERGDLLELLGNLLENAFKWARHRVLLTVRARPAPGRQRYGLLLRVEDDGPGIAHDKVELILQRGVRGDERVKGHGIGLSIVQDLVKTYRGDLRVSHSVELGGARFTVDLPSP